MLITLRVCRVESVLACYLIMIVTLVLNISLGNNIVLGIFLKVWFVHYIKTTPKVK